MIALNIFFLQSHLFATNLFSIFSSFLHRILFNSYIAFQTPGFFFLLFFFSFLSLPAHTPKSLVVGIQIVT